MRNRRAANLATITTLLLLHLAAASLQAQQTYVGHYDAYAGFTDLYTPELGLNQTGFHTQVGINPRTWYSVGFDYSVSTGSEVLTTDLLPTALQAQVNAAQAAYIAAGLLPPNYHLAVPTDATTQTFALGPQLAFRHFSRATIFVRPSLGALRERAVPHPTDPFSTLVAHELAPAGFKLDWTGFYGAGGGADFVLTKHFGLRTQIDIVHDHPFNDILANGRWTYRFAVGPSFHLGRNVAVAKSTQKP
jgi:hypothetical protein